MSAADSTQTGPALVVLHGHDSTAREADQLASSIDPHRRYRHISPEGPYETQSGAREWFSSTAGSLAATQPVLAALFAELSEHGPVVVVGYSQGGAAALATLTAPNAPTVAAVACVSGYLGEEPGLDHDVSRLADTAVLIQHGRDDDVVPQFMATDLLAALEAAGVPVTAHWFDMGHERTDESLAALRDWIDEQDPR